MSEHVKSDGKSLTVKDEKGKISNNVSLQGRDVSDIPTPTGVQSIITVEDEQAVVDYAALAEKVGVAPKTTKEKVEITISTTCECTYCPACNVGMNGYGPCDECGGELQSSGECFDCQPTDYLNEEIAKWLKKSRAVNLISSGKNMGWTHASGEGELPASVDNVMRFVTLNGDYTLKFVFEKDEPIRITRYSHDEPTGASFEIFRKVRQYQKRK